MKIECISEYEKIITRFNNSNTIKDFFFFDSTDKFSITKHRDGKYPAIITISGFLSEEYDNRLNWENSIKNAFPEQEWFHLEWNTQKNPFIKKSYTSKPQTYKPPKITNNLKWIKVSSTLLFSYTRFTHLLINNWWHLTVRNSKHTGKFLAEILMACEKKEFILVGHSLGARVIHNCLEQIGDSNVKTNIAEVYLLGGAVNSRSLKWKKTIYSVKNKIYNYYSSNDKILKFLYSSIMIDKFPIGLRKVDSQHFINIDSTKYISGHSEYIPNFHIIKSKYQ